MDTPLPFMDILAAWHLACLLVVWTPCPLVAAHQLVWSPAVSRGSTPPISLDTSPDSETKGSPQPQQQSGVNLHSHCDSPNDCPPQLPSNQFPCIIPSRHLDSFSPGSVGMQLPVASNPSCCQSASCCTFQMQHASLHIIPSAA